VLLDSIFPASQRRLVAILSYSIAPFGVIRWYISHLTAAPNSDSFYPASRRRLTAIFLFRPAAIHLTEVVVSQSPMLRRPIKPLASCPMAFCPGSLPRLPSFWGIPISPFIALRPSAAMVQGYSYMDRCPPSLGISRRTNPHSSRPNPLPLPPFSGLSRQKEECSGTPGSLTCNHSDKQPMHLSDALSPGFRRLKQLFH
jgi:hypothetical protein